MTGGDEGESWPQYADELTPRQIEHLEYVAALDLPEYVPTPERRAVELLELARAYVERNRKNVEYADVPVPAGAVAEYEWGSSFPGEWRRSLVWGDYPTEVQDVHVLICGFQKPDGTYTRQIGLFVDDDMELTVEQARALAAALLKAADDFDRG